MTTKEKIEIMQAFEDGKVIEYQVIGGDWIRNNLFTIKISNPLWDWGKWDYRIKPEPEPETLLDRLKAEYGNHEVILLNFDDYGYLCLVDMDYGRHIVAQSMKGFSGYVYETKGGAFFSTTRPVTHTNGKTQHPVGVLFTKGNS